MKSVYALIIFSILNIAATNAQSKIVLIAGNKTHGPGEHEYVKTVRLLKVMLDKSGIKGLKTEVHFNGWPTDPTTLDDASLILFYADGSDDKEEHDPMITDDHWSVIKKQVSRGCGLAVLHYSTFAPQRFAAEFMQWVGGYFDYESGKPGASGSDAWYSAIKTETAIVTPVLSHPITRGLTEFPLHDEFYFKIHFPEESGRLKPALTANIPGVKGEQIVAWTIERKDGGRGFGFTGGHYYNNWENPAFRKFMLNALIWSANLPVPSNGVESRFYTDQEVAAALYHK